MSELDGKSKDILHENIEKLREIFPNIFSEGKVDIEKLQNELGEFKESENERYNFTWAGKSNAQKIALTQSTGTLRPCKDESKNWDTTQSGMHPNSGTEVPPPLDIGFKVLKLDSSNIKTWDSDYENLEQNLMDSVNNIKSDRTAEDLVYEILLKYGLDLTLPIEELEIDGKKLFNIGFGSLVCCLDENVTTDIVEKIVHLKKEFEANYGLEKMRVVFRDSSFENSVAKTNALQILKQNNIDEIVSV